MNCRPDATGRRRGKISRFLKCIPILYRQVRYQPIDKYDPRDLTDILLEEEEEEEDDGMTASDYEALNEAYKGLELKLAIIFAVIVLMDEE